jgi:hypothetical protein
MSIIPFSPERTQFIYQNVFQRSGNETLPFGEIIGKDILSLSYLDAYYAIFDKCLKICNFLIFNLIVSVMILDEPSFNGMSLTNVTTLVCSWGGQVYYNKLNPAGIEFYGNFNIYLQLVSIFIYSMVMKISFFDNSTWRPSAYQSQARTSELTLVRFRMALRTPLLSKN